MEVIQQLQLRPGQTKMPDLKLLLWGFSSSANLLASWLVFRSNVWRDKNGIARAVIYSVLYFCGNLLMHATQGFGLIVVGGCDRRSAGLFCEQKYLG
jgi:hypothetical protein